MLKIGLSSCFSDTFFAEESFAEMQKSGISAIELCCNKYDALPNFKDIRNFSEKFDIDLWSMHLPISRFLDISSLDTQINKAALDAHKDMINRGTDIGVGVYVIHPTSTPEPILDGDRDEKIRHAMECLNSLTEYAITKGAKIALENLPRTCLCNNSKEHLKMLSAHEKLGACFDLNHCLEENTADFLRAIGKRVITVHVSDRDNINERHWVPGEGIIDWKELMMAFKYIDYRGAWIYELDKAATPTIEREDITFAQLVENAKALFKGEKPIAIGIPKPNLGLWGPKE